MANWHWTYDKKTKVNIENAQYINIQVHLKKRDQYDNVALGYLVYHNYQYLLGIFDTDLAAQEFIDSITESQNDTAIKELCSVLTTLKKYYTSLQDQQSLDIP